MVRSGGDKGQFPFLWMAREGLVEGSPLGWGLRETFQCMESVRKNIRLYGLAASLLERERRQMWLPHG